MKSHFFLAAVALACLVSLSGCGSGADRSSLAKQAVHTYWDDVGHLKLGQAYALLSPGVQQSMPEKDFGNNIVGFLQSTAGISADVHKATVVGDCAQVALGLISPKAPGGEYHVYQSLYWLNGGWRITNPAGGTSQNPVTLTSCPTGA